MKNAKWQILSGTAKSKIFKRCASHHCCCGHTDGWNNLALSLEKASCMHNALTCTEHINTQVGWKLRHQDQDQDQDSLFFNFQEVSADGRVDTWPSFLLSPKWQWRGRLLSPLMATINLLWQLFVAMDGNHCPLSGFSGVREVCRQSQRLAAPPSYQTLVSQSVSQRQKRTCGLLGRYAPLSKQGLNLCQPSFFLVFSCIT